MAAALRALHLREIAAHDPFFLLHDVDSRLYDAWARNVLDGRPPVDGVLYLGPLYAYFLALVYTVADATPAAVKAVQCALGVASVALVAGVARELFEPRVALLAALLAAVYEMLIFYGGTLMTVNLQVPLALAVVWIAGRALRRPTALRWLACGLCCGLAALAQQNALAVAPLLVGWLIASQRARLAAPRLAALAALFGVGVAAPIAPFTLHNARAGDLVLLNSTGGANLYMGNNPYTDGTWVPPRIGLRVDNPLAMREAFTRIAEQRVGRALAPSEVSAFWTREALGFVVGHPGAWLALELRKLLLFVNAREVWNIRAIEIERDFSRVLRLPLLTWGAVAPFALLGAALCARRWRALFALYAMVAATLATALVFFVLARYRIPAVPLLLIFAAVAGVWLADALRARRLRRAALAAVALLALAGVVRLPLGDDSLHMAHYNLGNRYLELSRWPEAIESYQRSIAIRPGFVSSHNNLALAYERAGRSAEAIDAWRRVLAWSLERGDAQRAERAQRHLAALGAPPEPEAPVSVP